MANHNTQTNQQLAWFVRINMSLLGGIDWPSKKYILSAVQDLTESWRIKSHCLAASGMQPTGLLKELIFDIDLANGSCAKNTLSTDLLQCFLDPGRHAGLDLHNPQQTRVAARHSIDRVQAKVQEEYPI